jgi:hypothetical protein
MKKVKLVAKKPSRIKRFDLNTQVVHFSGFCATDNKNFALFNVSEQFLVDNGFNVVLDFKLTEDDLWMLIDRNQQIQPQIGLGKVNFPQYGMVNKMYFDLMTSNRPSCMFFPVIEWFGKASNKLIVGLPNREGKPIGILKTVKEEETNNGKIN